ncbi:putative reverse transcriptase domain-containing protein, partial [Tanacetum coccineum]
HAVIALAVQNEFLLAFHAISSMNLLQIVQPDAYKKLCDACPERWSRAHCPLVRYNYMTSNSVESVNACSVIYRKEPVLKLAEAYRAMVQQWYYERRKLAANMTYKITDWAAHKVGKKSMKSTKWVVKGVNEYQYEVSDGQYIREVNLQAGTCECRKWQLSGIPCGHVLDGVIHCLLGYLLPFRELPAKVNKARVIMSSATSAVTYTFVYTDSEPGRAFWGADDEEVSEEGIPRVIILGYDGLPIQPVAPPSPDYIPGPEDPQTPPVPQDEDGREPMFVQAHDPDYMPEPIYPEYIPLEDNHEFPAEEHPLPPIDSPTAESPGYVTESDPEEDPKETEDGPVDYPMDGRYDGDDDDGDSSRDDANDEDEDDEDEEEEEEEHLAPADFTIVVPVDEPIFPPEGTEPVIPPPSTDITIGARITVRPQTSISLPPEAEVERLLTMTTPSPSPPISLSPPSAREYLARCMAPHVHSPPLPPSSGCPTQIQTLRIESTQALIDAVTAALPPPPLPPSLYIPPLVDRSRYETGESSTARPTRGRGVDYGFVSMVDAEERRQGIRDVGYGIRDTWVDPADAVPEIAPMTVGEVNTRVIKLAELHERDTQDLYALLEDAQDSRSHISQRVNIDSQRVDLLMGDRMTLQETVWMVEEKAYASREAWAHSIGLSQATHQELQTHCDHVYTHETYLQAHQTQLQLQSTLIQT